MTGSIATPLRPNSLYYGDCLDVMGQWDSEQVDLIYLDPPFNSKADYNQLFGTENGVPAQVRAFTDTWTWNEAAAERLRRLEGAVAHPAHKAVSGLHQVLGESGMLAYLTYMAERLAECRRLLKPHGVARPSTHLYNSLDLRVASLLRSSVMLSSLK